MGMAQFVLLGDAAERTLLRGEENDGMLVFARVPKSGQIDFLVWTPQKENANAFAIDNSTMHAIQEKQGNATP